MNISLNSLNSWIRRLGRPQRQVPDVNLIPEEYLGTRGLSRNSLLIILIVVELLIAATLLQRYGGESLSTIREFLGAEEVAGGESAVLKDPLTREVEQAQTGLSNLQVAQNEINQQRVSWPELLDLIFNQAPDGVTATSFRQNGDEVTLSGRAQKHEDVFEYKNTLTASPFIAQVIVPFISAASGGAGDLAFEFKLALRKGVPAE